LHHLLGYPRPLPSHLWWHWMEIGKRLWFDDGLAVKTNQ
jgi:hypothetical protein